MRTHLLKVFDKDYHFYRCVKIDYLAVGVSGYVDRCLIHHIDYLFSVVFGDEAGKILAELAFGAIKVQY